MCTICSSTSDTKTRLNEIAVALRQKRITKKHADDLVAKVLGLELEERDLDAEAAWEKGRGR